MKKIAGLLFFMLFTIEASSQIENIELGQKISLKRVYLGIKSLSGIHFTKLNHSNYVSLQAAVMVNYHIDKRFYIRSYGALIIDKDNTMNITSFELAHNVFKKVSIHAGLISTPTTELRPSPTTWQSQVETKTQSTIIGGRTGIKLKYSISSKIKIIYGIHNHGQETAQHFKISHSNLDNFNFSMASYFTSDTFFSALDLRTNKIDIVVTYKDKEKISNSFFIRPIKNYELITDWSYDIQNRELVEKNIEFRKYFYPKNLPVKMLLSAKFNLSSKTFF